MPFAEIFVTQVLTFPGERKQRGTPGAAAPHVPVMHVSLQRTKLGRTPGSEPLRPLP